MRDLIKCPLVLAMIDHQCTICPAQIMRGELYYRDDRDRKAHQDCAEKIEAVSKRIRSA